MATPKKDTCRGGGALILGGGADFPGGVGVGDILITFIATILTITLTVISITKLTN